MFHWVGTLLACPQPVPVAKRSLRQLEQTARLTYVLLEESRHADIHRLSGSSRLAVQSMAILTVYQLLKISAKLERGIFLLLLVIALCPIGLPADFVCAVGAC